jgi:hypothetical protein
MAGRLEWKAQCLRKLARAAWARAQQGTSEQVDNFAAGDVMEVYSWSCFCTPVRCQK